ncbi:hypothetical protein KY346_00540 [Candidatus Woesearchaeota archaeon]|nr:hypothetical protein [Candidatus Woesearchaeota archaeon]
MKDNILRGLEGIESSLRSLKGLVNLNKSEFVSKVSIKGLSKEIAVKWFESIEKPLSSSFSLQEDTMKKYQDNFDKLLKLSIRKNARKSTYLKQIDLLLSNFKNDLIQPVLKYTPVTSKLNNWSGIFKDVTEGEKEYLNEAIKCADLNLFRASIVLGWCAVIDRIHRVIEMRGFKEFSEKSEEMRKKKDGRYKRCNKAFSINSLNELRVQVFDKDLLWILEYMNLIDPNQHDRLSLCFTMRNNCAHPGDAGISPENLLSFYSDVDSIIFKNPKFLLSK